MCILLQFDNNKKETPPNAGEDVEGATGTLTVC